MITTIPSTSNTLKNLLVSASSHSSYTNKELNDKKEEIINIFSTYVFPQIKEIYHPALFQEWKINLDAAQYERNIGANLYKPSEKKKIHRVDSGDYWSTSIKETIQRFSFLTIMKHTANNMEKIMVKYHHY